MAGLQSPPELELPSAAVWTARIAAWAPFPPASAQPAAGGLPPLKTAARGVWLRSDRGGVVCLRWRGAAAPPLLTVTMRNNQLLVSAPLAPGAFAWRLFCPAHGAPPPAAGGSSGHVLLLALPGTAPAGGADTHQPVQQHTFAMHFDTVQAGRECGALLQAIEQGLVKAATPPAPAATAAHWAPAAAAAAKLEPSGAPLPGGSLPPLAGSAGMGAGLAATEAAAAASAAGGPQATDASLFGYANQATLEQGIQARLEVMDAASSQPGHVLPFALACPVCPAQLAPPHAPPLPDRLPPTCPLSAGVAR